MRQAQRGAGGPIGVGPPLAETDHSWQVRFTHKPCLVYKSLATLVVTFTRLDAGEIQDGVVRATRAGIVRTTGEGGDGVGEEMGYCELLEKPL